MFARLFGRDSARSLSSGIGTSGNCHPQAQSQSTGLDSNNAVTQSPSLQPQCEEQLGIVEDMSELDKLAKRSHVSIIIPRYRVNGSYIEYIIECTQGQKLWHVYRRYHQFKVLDQSLRQLCTRGTPNHGDYGVLPVLPVSHWMEVTNQSTQLVEKRRRYLEIYLQQLLVPGNLFIVARTPLYVFLHEGEVVCEMGMRAIQPLIGFSSEAVEVESELCTSTDGSDDSHTKWNEAASNQVMNPACTPLHDLCHSSQLRAAEPPSTNNASSDETKTKIPITPLPMLPPPLCSVSVLPLCAGSAQDKVELDVLHANQEFQEQRRGQSSIDEGGIASSSLSRSSKIHVSEDKAETLRQSTFLSSSLVQNPLQAGTLATPRNSNNTHRSFKSSLVPLCLDVALPNVAPISSSYAIFSWGNEDARSKSDNSGSTSPFFHTVSYQGAELGNEEDKQLSPSPLSCRSCHREFSSELFPHRCFFCHIHFCFRCLWKISLRPFQLFLPPSPNAEPNQNALSDTENDTTKVEEADEGEKKRVVNACVQCTEHYKRRLLHHSQTTDAVHAAPDVQAASESPPMPSANHEGDSKQPMDPETLTSGSDKGLPTGVGLHDFQLITLLGHGSFGRVIKVRLLSTGAIYAMKVLNKSLAHQRSMDSYIKEESSILTMLPAHPYIVNCHFAFQTNYYIIFILDYLPGGELYDIMYHRCRLTHSAVQLYMAELVLAIEHIHNHDVVHRDIKPENILLDAEGHLRLNDFGLAHANFSQYTQRSFVGSAEYVAPEMIRCEKQTPALDWWNLGVLFYEMLRGYTPFHAKNNNEVYENILHKELDLSDQYFFTPEAASLIQNLLTRDAKVRLQHVKSIKEHPYFSGINWDPLLRREVPAPFVPEILNNNTRYFKRDFTAEWAVLPDPTSRSSSSIEILRQCFDNFPYVKDNFALCSSDPHNGFSTTTQISPTPGFQLQPLCRNPTTVVINTPEVFNRELCREQLVGMWRVVKVETHDLNGRIIYPWGGDVVGYLIYTSTQHFSMQLAPRSRRCLRHSHHPRNVPCEELYDVYCSYVAQFGRYEIDEGKPWCGKLRHHIEGSLCPNLAGHSVVMGLDLYVSSPLDAPSVNKAADQNFTVPLHSSSVQMANDAKHHITEEPRVSSGRLLLALSTMLHYVPGKPFKAQTIITWEKLDVA